jgi:hypothetical protein
LLFGDIKFVTAKGKGAGFQLLHELAEIGQFVGAVRLTYEDAYELFGQRRKPRACLCSKQYDSATSARVSSVTMFHLSQTILRAGLPTRFSPLGAVRSRI